MIKFAINIKNIIKKRIKDMNELPCEIVDQIHLYYHQMMMFSVKMDIIYYWKNRYFYIKKNI